MSMHSLLVRGGTLPVNIHTQVVHCSQEELELAMAISMSMAEQEGGGQPVAPSAAAGRSQSTWTAN